MVDGAVWLAAGLSGNWTLQSLMASRLDEVDACGEASAVALAVPPRVVDIVRQPSFWATVAGGFCNAYALYFTIIWLPFYLVHDRSLSMPDIVNKSALYYAVDAASALVTGYLTDFWIRRGWSTTVVRKSAMGLRWMIAAIGLLGCSGAGSHSYFVWLLVASVGCRMGNSGLWTFTQTFAGTQAAGRWTVMQNAFGNLAGVIGPALTGFIVDWTGHFQIALAITASVCLLKAFIWVFVVPQVKPVTWRHPATGNLAQTASQAA